MTENRESTCAKCGRKITAADINCPLCGALTAPGRLEPKSRVAYVLLAFFFGWAGIHNFYAKRTGEGLVQLGVTLLSCGLMLWAVELWVLIEMFTVSRDGRNVPMRGRGILTAAILLAAGALLFFGAVGYPFYLRCRQEAALTGCREHLSRIGAALLLYADENGGAFPAADGIPGFEALPLAEAEVWVCPSGSEQVDFRRLSRRNCSYVYLGGADREQAECPVAFELPGNHARNRVNILYADGRVETHVFPGSVRSAVEVIGVLADLEPDPELKAFLLRKR
ncbi:TM2 domain-containing protein [uncultured Victivallis sp.]|uniref:TM2 domain-containing protein n=1 Tax=uncultured Victivallis sp. TaxID=354118 RepID=UPI00258E9AB6|nr:TM2 domain-containing protein [uncultured Victivallis sp.]